MRPVQTLPTVPMKRYGTNPYDEPLYRVVFSDSRTDLIGGKWPDGVCDYREVRRYPEIHNWVLEKWMTPVEYAGEKDDYERQQFDPDSGLYTCGPYPNRGEYQLCYVFPYAPGDSEILKVVTAIKLSRDIHPAHRKEAIMGRFDESQRDRDRRFENIWGDSMGPFESADAVVSFAPNHGRQGFKRASDMPIVHGQKDIPLPKGDNFFGTILNKDTLRELSDDSYAR